MTGEEVLKIAGQRLPNADTVLCIAHRGHPGKSLALIVGRRKVAIMPGARLSQNKRTPRAAFLAKGKLQQQVPAMFSTAK